jgi:molybdopterin adenylyltransferase
MTTDTFEPVKIGIVSVSDRASSGGYEDKGLPALKAWLERALKNPITFDAHLIPDEKPLISQTLLSCVHAGCSLVLTTGGTGPARRDVTSRLRPRWQLGTKKCLVLASKCAK